MITEDQSEVIEFLSRPATHGTSDVERLETHASVVFLAGDHALKLKRAVQYDYLDFSTCDRRRRMCEAELLLNRRTAPTLYERLVPVTREADGHLSLAGNGPAVDWLVRMRRFDQDALFDRLAARDALPLALMAPLGESIARLHRRAAPRVDRGGLAAMFRVVDGNARSFDQAPADVIDHARARRLVNHQQSMLAHDAPRLETRRQQGLVRYCHGDLHLRNLVLLDGEPTLFDGIEFNEDLACIDVHYDLAFLLMDLWRRGLHQHANGVWNAYLASTTDFGGLPLLPLFLSCRAAIRAKTSLTTASLAADDARRTDAQQLSREYLTLAERFLDPAPPAVVAIGGLSGSGKSAVAGALASELGRVPGAVVTRSDVIRKWLCGVEPTTRLATASYTAEHAQHVYTAVIERCRVVADTGHAAVADAVFGRQEQRAAIRACAAAAHVPFTGVWLDAPREMLLARLAARTGDASDADGAVAVRQALDVTPPDDWRHVDASRPLDAVVGDVLALVRASSAPVDDHAGAAAHEDAAPASMETRRTSP
jgi:hypothetical protein